MEINTILLIVISLIGFFMLVKQNSLNLYVQNIIDRLMGEKEELENKNKESVKLIYKNFLGKHNVLITETVDGYYPTKVTYVGYRDKYDARIWIHDNKVVKLHTDEYDEFIELDQTLTEKEIKNVVDLFVTFSN